MHLHLSRLLKHRLLLPSTSSSSSAAAAFSTSKRTYARRTKPPTSEHPEGKPGEDAAASVAALETGAGWQREKPPSELPRPPTIPFQPRVANAVRLVGTVGAPVQLQRMPDGRFSAVSVLVQDRRTDFPKFWIPVIFQDDLAQVAASHLQENDLVYVSGQLTGDVPPFKITDCQANIQVLAHLLSFVDSKAVETVNVDEEEGFLNIADVEKKVEQKKFKPIYPPGIVSGAGFGTKLHAPNPHTGFKNKRDKLNTLWKDVLTSPQDWNDNRALKKNGSKSARFPDFTNKNSKEALWLDSAPPSVLEKLDDMVLNSGNNAGNKDKPLVGSIGKGTDTAWMKFKTSKGSSSEMKQKLEADLWQNLVDNPKNWWDNRSDKLTTRHPDFKHKETGEALWIGPKTPHWAIDALPIMKAKEGSNATRKPETLLS